MPNTIFQTTVRATTAADYAQTVQFIREQWGEDAVVSRGVLYQPSTLPGFLAEYDGNIAGLLTYHIKDNECEIVTIDATQRLLGVGTMRLDAVIEAAKEAGCHRLWLITTNDNLPALRFYQRRGFVLVAVHRNAIETSRTLKASIPKIGIDGIPIRDEIELEIDLRNEK
ncbi:MAG: GNAT family N-acetyltransferase [Anaerolineae bacterium]|nr:GNAT family N-acetyltransferase [Anaerolineae bacterium]